MKSGRQSDVYQLWIKTEDDGTIRLDDNYNPTFYVEPKNEELGNELVYELSKNNDGDNGDSFCQTSWQERRTSIFSDKTTRVIEVVLQFPPRYLRSIVRRLEQDSRVKQLFNTDLSILQQYLFSELKVEPTSKVNIEYEGTRLLEVTRVDDEANLCPPPFTTLHFSLKPDSEEFLSGDAGEEEDLAIEAIECNLDGGITTLLQGSEGRVIEDFKKLVADKDPDILVCQDCDNITFPWLAARAIKNDVKLDLGRGEERSANGENPIPNRRISIKNGKKRLLPQQPYVSGRVVLDFNSRPFPFSELGLAGLVERSRFSFLPMEIASRWGSNRIIDSRNCYELIQQGCVIPANRGFYEPIRTLEQIFKSDKGSMVISPQVGLHANVAVLDYDSEYPNIIVRNNLSYETVTASGVRNNFQGLLPKVMKRYLSRRTFFKQVVKEGEQPPQERQWASQRAASLKTILVSMYGTAGCCWSRFGNVLTFEEVNRRSRETMIRTKELAMSMGFNVIYGDTDAVFVKKAYAMAEEYLKAANTISNETGLPISVSYHYKFLVLLPIEADEKIDALKRYFGITYDGDRL